MSKAKFLLDGLWLVALALFVLAGVDKVPFHGDESMLVSMSQDYAYLVQQHTADPVKYQPNPPDPSQQELRILNGTTGKMAMGLAWDLAGYSLEDLNDPWWWGFSDPSGNWNEWTWNIYSGHKPGDGVLHAARVSSAVLGIIGLWAVFAITRGVTRQRWAAYAATLILVTSPPVILNIRRAMMEGSLLAFTMLTVLAALWVMIEQARVPRRRWALMAAFIALGLMGGLALSSKHTGGIAVAAAFVAVLGAPLVKREFSRREALITFGGLIGAGLLVIITFLLLNPVWWSDPVKMPERVLDARQKLLDAQTVGAKLDGTYYEQFSDRTEGLMNQAFLAEPEFYEVAYWQEFIGDEIDSYSVSWLAGRQGGAIWGALLIAAFAFGLAELADHWREGPALLVLVWLIVTAVALLVTTPFEWQRYYLPLQPPLAIVSGIGVWRIGVFAGQMVRWKRGQHVA